MYYFVVLCVRACVAHFCDLFLFVLVYLEIFACNNNFLCIIIIMCLFLFCTVLVWSTNVRCYLNNNNVKISILVL